MHEKQICSKVSRAMRFRSIGPRILILFVYFVYFVVNPSLSSVAASYTRLRSLNQQLLARSKMVQTVVTQGIQGGG
jgi:hypothetical protein